MEKYVVGQLAHDMLAVPNQDELSRQLFVQTLSNELGAQIQPGCQPLFDNKVRPAFKKANGREISHVTEVRKAMLKEPYTQMWSSIKRLAKELTYEAVGPSVERQLPELLEKAERYRGSNSKLGSLQLDPSVKCPRYNSEVEIHCKPGGYHTDLTENDVFAGAEYDRTLYLTNNGVMGPTHGDRGKAMALWIRETYPNLKPTRILDMGCTVGHSTVSFCEVFPEAEVHAIDVGAPVLRYGHARAEALGAKIHFSQQNLEHTRFPDGHFDLIVSVIVLHEISNKALRNMFKECNRLLRKGGIMAHTDTFQYRDLELLDQFIPGEWDTHYNAEPFVTALHLMDLAEVAQECGFEKDKIEETYIPPINMMGTWKGRRPQSLEKKGRYVIVGER